MSKLLRKRAIRISVLCAVLCSLALLTACDRSKKNGSETTPTVTAAPAASGCEVHILDIGKADAIFLCADGVTMLIDAGYPSNADTVIAYLKAQSVSKLDYVIMTHGDIDHVGGMADVLREFAVGQMFISPKKEKSDAYAAMVAAVKEKNISCISPEVGAQYTFGNGSFTVLAPGPKALKEGSDNDASIAIRLVYGERSFLLMGDALSTTEKELIDSSYTIRADVLKTGHHGKSDATNKKFLKAVQPKYAVICCGRTEDGEEGTPATKVLDLLSDFHVITYRTDLNGTVVFKTDGTTLTCNCDAEQE